MKMNGEEVIKAPIETVWAALNDPEILRQCIPGCESITKTSATSMKARVVAKVGPVKAGFNGNVELKDLKPPHSYRIEGKGEGGLAGFATGGASIQLEEVPEGTRMTYDVDAQIGGKLAMLGSRLIDSTAQSMATQFFEKFATLAAQHKVAPARAVAKKAAAKKKSPAKKVAAKKAAKAPVKKKAAKKKKK
ncbi:MAG: carbon monoxide dehydrogenase subunit G [Proteobacteria bacterium]|nr:carbon monoxide dehydrogenase subunit G [Pseudomonadota bacterium]